MRFKEAHMHKRIVCWQQAGIIVECIYICNRSCVLRSTI